MSFAMWCLTDFLPWYLPRKRQQMAPPPRITTRTWVLDVCAPNRATARNAVKSISLPQFAEDHFIGILDGEDYIYMGAPNPDQPVRVFGRGQDAGDFVFIACAGIEYGTVAGFMLRDDDHRLDERPPSLPLSWWLH
jgi:hypothetical protein